MNKVFVEMSYEEYINFMESKGKVNINEAIEEMVKSSLYVVKEPYSDKYIYSYQNEKYIVKIYER